MFLLLLSALSYAEKVDRVIMIMLENTEADKALKQPYLRSLSKKGAYASHSFALTHPSQPNYFALIAGETFHANDSRYDLDDRHLGDLLEDKKKTWKTYAEAYPGNCFTEMQNGNYVRRHVPFISFKNVSQNKDRCERIRPANEFLQDHAANTLPNFSLYVPDLQNDGHDTSPTFIDQYMRTQFDSILSKELAKTLVIITFDEDAMHGNNRIYTTFLGAGIRPHTITRTINHYTILRTIEEALGLGSLGKNDAKEKPIDLWNN